ncbi:MAG: aromatic acid exporter family protein [Coprococcus sp.]
MLLLALKTAIGGSAAIYIAEKIGLQFAPSAGIIAMLSLVSTKWGTLKLSLLRVLTFFDVSCTLLGNFSLDVWQMD